MWILIAEDDDISRHSLSSMLKKQGYEVVEAQDGEQAWELLQELTAPVLLVLDIMMPKMNGLELCQKLQGVKALEKTYIILLTARVSKEDVVQGLDSGANDYITKPYDYEELRARINVGQRMLEMQSDLLQEVSDREQAEDALRESEEKLVQILYGSPIATFVIDREHKISHWNSACERLTGFSSENMRGTSEHWKPFYTDKRPLLADIVIDSQLDGTMCQYSDIGYKSFLKQGAFEAEEFFPCLGENGKWLFCTASPLFDHNDNLTGAIQTIDDITERKFAEETLRKREEQLSDIAANIPGVVYQFYVTKSGEMGFLYVSQRVEQILGMTLDTEGWFEKFLSHVHEEDRGRLWDSIHTAVSERKNWDFEGRFVKDSGEILWFKGLSTPRQHKDHLVFHGILLDISEQKRAEISLRENERKLQTLMSNLPGMVYRCFNQSRWPMRFVSEGCKELTGYSVEEMIYRDDPEYGDLIYPDDAGQVWERVQEEISDKNGYQLEYRITTKKGQEKWVWEQGQLIGVDVDGYEILEGFITDVTERKKAEEKLRESEEKYRTVFENTGAATYIVEPDTTISMVNKKFEQISGCSREEVEGKMSWSEFAIKEDLDWLKKYHYERRQNGNEQVPDQFEFRFVDKYGEIRHGHMTIGVIPNTKKSVASMVDITEHKQVEEERKKLQDQLLQSQKMESVGRLAGGVAHDLNNMLVPILGYTDMLLQDVGIHESHKKWIEFINHAGLRSRDLVEQLLAFSRKQTLKMESLDLNQIILNFQKLLNKTIREYITIEFHLANDLPYVYADRSQLEQIILNLAVNAQEAMSSGGVLTIETKVVYLDEKYADQHMEMSPGQYILLEVSDTGAGMDKETQERIFEPFFSTKGLEEGSGLGLATVYGIVKQHQGNIWVYSEPEQGTTFKIYLPVSESAREEDPMIMQDQRREARGQETVFVVEDNEMVREMTVEVLQDHGYNVLYADNGGHCLELLQSHSGQLDLVLTDIIMPDMNGKDLFEQVTQRFPQARVLYMSGYPENVISNHGILEQGVNFIQKPFSVQDLCLKVREILDYK